MRAVSNAGFAAVVLVSIGAGIAGAEPKHGISMYGTPDLPPDFQHLPYANPDAPKGGEMLIGEKGGFDSLNPYILKGTAPYNIRS
ncbi:MAG: ABC transporter substrate-binding protein, partial [Pseudomonadota bacterium]